MDSAFQSRSLGVVIQKDLTALECIGWVDPVGGLGLRVFYAHGTKFEGFDPKHKDGFAKFSEARMIGGSPLFVGGHEEASNKIKIALANGEMELPVQSPETDLFADMNVCVAERNGESIEVIEAWARYHIRHHGLEGLLLLERAKPGKAKQFSKKLSKLAEDLGLKRLVHLTSDVPLGHPDLPAASHVFNATDAPGKDRMGKLKPDPWTSPLAALSIYELCKWRFLSRARAVMNLDLTDILPINAQPFEAVHLTENGTLNLVGQRVYPWRVRNGKKPGFGDHICRQFDNPRGNKRWCVSPAKTGANKIWRLVRIVEADAGPGEQLPFWRAMAIRHPKANSSELVPKTSLIEDEELLHLARKVWDHKPVRPPQSKVAKSEDTGSTCIVTCMKNEGPFILEWVAYHRSIGIENFLVYTNDCTDGTDELLDLLQARGLVTRRDNKFHGTALKPQHWALAAADKETMVQDASWAISMDVDEFINIHVGAGRMEDLFTAVGDANLISMTWRLFGNANVHQFEDQFLIQQFDHCAPELIRKPHQAWGFKTLFRNNGLYKKMGVHRPKGLKPDLWEQINWVNGSGKPMPKKLLRNGWRSTTESYGYDLVTLNHYAVRSAESFLVKRDRGRVNHVDRDQGLSYWFRMNNNAEIDRSIQTKLPLVQAEYDRLIQDPEIAAAHAHCVAQHQAKITELKARPDYATFYEELTGTRMERLSHKHSHFGSNVFLSGPEVIPDKIALAEDLEPDFFFTVERQKTSH